MSERLDTEKADFNEVLRELLTAALESAKGSEKFKLHVEDAEAGLVIYNEDILADCPENLLEDIVYPVYQEDLKEDAILLVDMDVRDVVQGLLSKMLIRVYINDNREVEIKHNTIYEAEVSARDLADVKLRGACEELLEEKANVISKVLKAAIVQMMDGR